MAREQELLCMRERRHSQEMGEEERGHMSPVRVRRLLTSMSTSWLVTPMVASALAMVT